MGPFALNIQAPDEGNTNLLDKVATPAQKERWLGPLVRGEIRTVFSMTDRTAAPAGSDIDETTARRVGDDFVINGRKWLITGAPGAAINIVMARTEDAGGKDLGATMFFVDMNAPGFWIKRILNTIDSNSPGGHAEVDFTTCESARSRFGGGRQGISLRADPAWRRHA